MANNILVMIFRVTLANCFHLQVGTGDNISTRLQSYCIDCLIENNVTITCKYYVPTWAF